MRIVQLIDSHGQQRVAHVKGAHLQLVTGYTSTYAMTLAALEQAVTLPALVTSHLSEEWETYATVLASGRILSPVTHPNPARLWVTGTGLTHLGSAAARDSMHKVPDEGQTDSMRMFQMGLKAGKPADGDVGVQPEWFYKGNGTTIVAPESPIYSPAFALLDGDEIEVCACYVNDAAGNPHRIGYALGNEFSDHKTEKINYLYLAHSKLRPCAFGPELLLEELPADVRGTSRIIRDGMVIWEEEFLSGEENMSHSIANLEYHHFKYELFQQPFDVHCHFFGTATASFSKGIEPRDGDIFEMEAAGFGAPLRNTLRIQHPTTVAIKKLY
ncbi:MAG: AraD1 family protein [Bacteroidota bacterium]